MELKTHFQQTLLLMLLMLLMALAPYAWQNSKECPKQGLPSGGDCSRFQKYCPPGTVCEEWDHIYACKVYFGNSCSTTEQCVTSASCVGSKCECGRILTRPEATITTTNYPDNYTEKENCVWIIAAPENYVIKLTFLDFDVEQDSGGDPLTYDHCPWDYLKLFNGTEADTPEFLMICGQGNPEPIFSPGNVLRMVFHSDEVFQFKGFMIKYNFLSQGQLSETGIP